MDEFESQDVIDLVEGALAEEGPNSLKPTTTIPLGLAQGDLLERVYKKLEQTLDHATLTMLYDDLRAELYSGIELPELKELHTTALHCRKCKDAVKSPAMLPKWNMVDPDCLFIIDNPFYSEEVIKFFLESLVEAGFSSKRVCLTYVNRCPAVEKLNAGHVKNCTPYLHTEIQILKPKLIVTLGLLSTAAVLGAEVTLGSLRGKTVWVGPWAIMPTYAPAYVVKSGEGAGSSFKTDLVTAYSFCYGD